MRPLALALLLSILGGCAGSRAAARRDLGLVPTNATVVVGVNLDRLQTTPLWRRAADTVKQDAKMKGTLERFAAECTDFDAPDGPRSILFWLDAADKDSGAILVRFPQPMSESRVTACAAFAKVNEAERLATIEYSGKRIWTMTAPDQPDKGGLTMLDDRTIGLGNHDSVRALINRSAGTGPAGASANIASLLARAERQRSLWFVAEVSPAWHAALAKLDRAPSLASVSAIIAAVDFAPGIALDVSLDTSSPSDAIMLQTQLSNALATLKSSPQVLMLGFKPYFDGITVRDEGASVHVSVRVTDAQVDDLITRAVAILRGFAKETAASPAAK